ncbi:MAG: NAD(P)H-hydrate dehydratase [Ignavibacteria bacterium]
MKPAFTFDEIREVEKTIITKDGIPSLILMENAGKNTFDLIVSLLPDIEDHSIYIFCGKGNNAGDGYVVARQFLINSIPVSLVNLAADSELTGDALTNYRLLVNLSSNLLFAECINEDNIPAFFDDLRKQKGKILIIDALLGSGIKGEVTGKFRSVIEQLNNIHSKNKKVTVISIDVPSGLSGSGEKGVLINADHTITMGAVKTELLYGNGKENSGNLYVVPIGITSDVLERHNSYNKYLVTKEDIKNLLPRRKRSSYKYSNGKAFVIGGSRGLSGAVIMSSFSALKSGSGAVLAAFPKGISSQFGKKLYEVIKTELDETSEGSIAADSYHKIAKQLDKADAILIGPGLSLNKETAVFLKELISNCKKPLVIDADALTLLAEDIGILNSRNSDSELILTPHLGEFSRLSALSTESIIKDRFSAVKYFTSKYGVNVVLKSETSISCTPNGSIYINNSGNEQLGSAGSGDILSGIIVSILAQTGDVTSAMLCGNYIHGKLAEKYYERSGNKQTSSQQDLIKLIPEAITELLN